MVVMDLTPLTPQLFKAHLSNLPAFVPAFVVRLDSRIWSTYAPPTAYLLIYLFTDLLC